MAYAAKSGPSCAFETLPVIEGDHERVPRKRRPVVAALQCTDEIVERDERVPADEVAQVSLEQLGGGIVVDKDAEPFLRA